MNVRSAVAPLTVMVRAGGPPTIFKKTRTAHRNKGRTPAPSDARLSPCDAGPCFVFQRRDQIDIRVRSQADTGYASDREGADIL